MKILHVYKTYYPDSIGGIEEAIKNICISTQKFGISSKIYTLSVKPNPEIKIFDYAEVVRSKSFFSPFSCDIGGISCIAKFNELAGWADIIHYHFPWPFADILHMLMRPEKKRVVTYHSDIVRQKIILPFYYPLMAAFINDMDRVIVTSPNYYRSSEYLNKNVDERKIRLIPLGLQDYSDSKDDPISNYALHFKDIKDRPFVLFLGVLRYYKGLSYLLDAASQIKGLIVIAGSGPEEKKLKNRIKSSNISNVLMIGRVTDEEKKRLLFHATAFILPSHLRSEAFGVSLIEASMFSKPMISCEIGTGTSYVNQNNVTGFVVSPANPKQISIAINSLFENSYLASSFGNAARLRYMQLFSGDRLGLNHANLYRELI